MIIPNLFNIGYLEAIILRLACLRLAFNDTTSPDTRRCELNRDSSAIKWHHDRRTILCQRVSTQHISPVDRKNQYRSLEQLLTLVFCCSRVWSFELRSEEDARRAVKAATDSLQNPRLGLLGIAGVCMESSSPEPTSGSASGTNRALFGRMQ